MHIIVGLAFSEFFFVKKKWPYHGQITFLKYNEQLIFRSAIFLDETLQIFF